MEGSKIQITSSNRGIPAKEAVHINTEHVVVIDTYAMVNNPFACVGALNGFQALGQKHSFRAHGQILLFFLDF